VAKWSRNQAGKVTVGAQTLHLQATFDPGLPKKQQKIFPALVWL